MALKICLGIVFFIFILLIIPVRYSFTFEMKKLTVKVETLFGLYTKIIEIPKEKKKEISESEENKDFEEETEPIKKEEAVILEENGSVSEKKNGKDEDTGEDKDKDKRPPLWKQLRFALRNGLAENVCKALAAILYHSIPRKWDFWGEFGTGDPMQAGMLAGMATAFLPDVTKNVVWKYVEPSYKLKGKGQGRAIPFYVVCIVLRLLVSAPAREFWRYRQGGIHDE